MTPVFSRVDYQDPNSRQKENYNFQKVPARLADYGFNCLRLTDDWEGADFLACHRDGDTVLMIQLKGRFSIDKKYIRKDIFIAFIHGTDCYVYPHDIFLDQLLKDGRTGLRGQIGNWETKGVRSWPQPAAWALDILGPYRI